MLPKTAERKTALHLWAVVALLAIVLTACQTSVGNASTAPAESEAAAMPASAESGVLPMDPLAADQSAPPARLEIPDLNLDVDVVPMGWQIVTVDGERTTMWKPPEEQAGWHVNSAHAGAAATCSFRAGRRTAPPSLLRWRWAASRPAKRSGSPIRMG